MFGVGNSGNHPGEAITGQRLLETIRRWIDDRIPQAVVRRVEEHTSYGGRDLCAIEFMEVSNETRNSIISFIFDEQRVTIQRVRR